jgi:hypothetical protein
MIRAIKKNNYLLVYLLIIAIVNLFLLTLPLTNVFGYEFSAVNALLISFLSGLYLLSYFKSNDKEKNDTHTKSLFKTFIVMLLVPIVISLAKSIIFGFCSFWDGLCFYLIITTPSVIIGGAIGSFVHYVIRRFRVIAFILLFILILLIPVLEIYFNPQIYLYNPLFAYFPGTIYDEGLSVDFKLILYRFFNLLFFSSVLFYFLKWRNKPASKFVTRSYIVMIIIIVSVFYFFFSPFFGFTNTNSSLKNQLSFCIESKHFIIHTDKRIEKKDLKLIVLNQEYYYSQLSNFFNDAPDTKITAYIFFDKIQKRQLFGSGNADVSKPWLNSVYVSYDSWESTLKHEIAHCFTAKFGSGVFKLAAGFNPALIEGVAEAADGFYDENGIDYLASLAFKNKYRIDINSLFSSFSFFGSVSSLSYIYSGSFIKYLTAEYGIDKVKKLYYTNDFENTYNEKLETIDQDYEKFLDTLKTISTKERANYYFGRKSLISKVCPRYISSSLTEAWEFYSIKEYSKASNIFENILSKSENYSSIVGLAKIYEDSDSLEKAINILKTNIEIFSGTSSEYDLKFRLAELYVKNDELPKARKIYELISETKPSRRLQLLSHSRIALLNEGTIKEYVTGSDFDKYVILKKLNSKFYNYATIPLMIDLSDLLDEDYYLFLDNFRDYFEVKDEISSYAVYKISEYMLSNFDYVNARKFAGLALRYKGNPNLTELFYEQFKKTEWFVKNSDRVLSETNIKLN